MTAPSAMPADVLGARATSLLACRGFAVADRAVLDEEGEDECASCGEGDPSNECPKSGRSCGHHCNHIWSHDCCHWCGFEEVPQ